MIIEENVCGSRQRDWHRHQKENNYRAAHYWPTRPTLMSDGKRTGTSSSTWQMKRWSPSGLQKEWEDFAVASTAGRHLNERRSPHHQNCQGDSHDGRDMDACVLAIKKSDPSFASRGDFWIKEIRICCHLGLLGKRRENPGIILCPLTWPISLMLNMFFWRILHGHSLLKWTSCIACRWQMEKDRSGRHHWEDWLWLPQVTWRRSSSYAVASKQWPGRREATIGSFLPSSGYQLFNKSSKSLTRSSILNAFVFLAFWFDWRLYFATPERLGKKTFMNSWHVLLLFPFLAFIPSSPLKGSLWYSWVLQAKLMT